MTRIHDEELKPGDIIFFHALDGVPEHTAIYSGKRDGLYWILHSATGGKYFDGLQESVLKKQQHETYSVFRHHDSTLAQNVCTQITKWSKYKTPYDQSRARLMHLIGDSPEFSRDMNKYATFSEESHYKNFWRIIKFASRADVAPTNIIAEKHLRGMQCVQVIILAYQICTIKPFVKTLAELGHHWISDKHCMLNPKIMPPDYIDYADSLRQKHTEYDDFSISWKQPSHENPEYLPSYLAWKHEEDPQNYFKRNPLPINLDAKITNPALLHRYLQKQPNWRLFERLEVGPPQFSPESLKKRKDSFYDLDRESAELCYRLRFSLSQSAPPKFDLNQDKKIEPEFINSRRNLSKSFNCG